MSAAGGRQVPRPPGEEVQAIAREGRKLRRRESHWERTQNKRKVEPVLPDSASVKLRAGQGSQRSQGWQLRLQNWARDPGAEGLGL